MGKAKYKHKFIGNGEWRDEHILISEVVLGRSLPVGAEVHHVDGNGLNNSNSNLVICPSRAYHQLLHRRERALEVCGHADWLKCRYCKQYDAPENLYIGKRETDGGLNTHHKKCDTEYARKRRLRN